MNMNKKKIVFTAAPVCLLVLSVALLMFSTIGSTRAALAYYSENYSVDVEVSNIGVSLVENGTVVSSRNYQDDRTDSAAKPLLASLTDSSNGEFLPGKAYEETLSVRNSGSIDSYVRVVLCKSWKDAAGEKDTELSPELIELNLPEGSGWVMDQSASTKERIVLYYTRVLAPGQETAPLCDTLRVNPEIFGRMAERETVTDKGTTITSSYEYDGYWISLKAEADAVQTHNGAEAVKSAWGVDVEIAEDGTLRLVQE